MSVIVKGMEMPQTGWECPINWRGVCGISGSHFCQDKRPNWCPLRPLPEKHGRLIDADALPKYTGYALSADEVATAIENAPTIVEAEGEETMEWKMKNCCCFGGEE